MSHDKLVKKYLSTFEAALADAVLFANQILGFKPYPYQEEFLRDQSPFIAACCGRQVGKTTLASIKALHFALSTPEARILIVSSALRQSAILLEKILDFIDASGPAQELVTHKSRMKVQFGNGSEILALPCGTDGATLRGYTADMIIFDEANFIPRIVIDSVIRPTTITKPNAQMIMISTPWGKDHPFYEAVSKPELGFKAYTWPTSINPKVSNERLELEKKSIGEHEFNREYNAVFMDEQFSYFPSQLVLSCTDDYDLNPDPAAGQRYDGEYCIGVDFGKHTDHTAIVVLQRLPSEELRLVYLKQFNLETPYTTIIGFIRMLDEAYSFLRGYLDQTGVGEGPYEAVREFMPAMQGITLSLPAKEDILGRLRLAMERGKITIPRDNTQLLTQITDQQCEPTPSGKLKFTHPPGTKDDLLWGLALANYSAIGMGQGRIIGVRPNF